MNAFIISNGSQCSGKDHRALIYCGWDFVSRLLWLHCRFSIVFFLEFKDWERFDLFWTYSVVMSLAWSWSCSMRNWPAIFATFLPVDLRTSLLDILKYLMRCYSHANIQFILGDRIGCGIIALLSPHFTPELDTSGVLLYSIAVLRDWLNGWVASVALHRRSCCGWVYLVSKQEVVYEVA